MDCIVFTFQRDGVCGADILEKNVSPICQQSQLIGHSQRGQGYTLVCGTQGQSGKRGLRNMDRDFSCASGFSHANVVVHVLSFLETIVRIPLSDTEIS